MLKYACLQKIDLLGDELLVEIINDTISFYLKNQKLPFLSKYAEVLQGAQNVAPIRELIINLIKLCMRKTHSASTLDVYKSSILSWLSEQEGFDAENLPINQKSIDIIGTSVYARREEIQQTLVEMILNDSSDKVLIDYNYNIELVMSSSSSQNVATPLLILELFLRVNHDEQSGENHGGKSIQRVLIEMDKEEARDFTQRLQEIEKEIVSI